MNEVKEPDKQGSSQMVYSRIMADLLLLKLLRKVKKLDVQHMKRSNDCKK